MKCPYCGGEMERGRMQSASGPYWLPGAAPQFFPAPTKSRVRAAGGIPLWEEIPLLFYARPAWICRSCKKLVSELSGDID